MRGRLLRILIVLAGVMGADGVMLAAASAHQADASRLASASSMLLFHATAILATVVLAERAIIHVGIGIVAGFGFVIAAALFAGDLTLRQYAGHGLFPFCRADRWNAADCELAGAGRFSGVAAARLKRPFRLVGEGNESGYFAPCPPIG